SAAIALRTPVTRRCTPKPFGFSAIRNCKIKKQHKKTNEVAATRKPDPKVRNAKKYTAVYINKNPESKKKIAVPEAPIKNLSAQPEEDGGSSPERPIVTAK